MNEESIEKATKSTHEISFTISTPACGTKIALGIAFTSNLTLSDAGREKIQRRKKDAKNTRHFAIIHNTIRPLAPSSTIMAESGTGIQELMAAETRASQIVAEARIGKYLKEHGVKRYERVLKN